MYLEDGTVNMPLIDSETCSLTPFLGASPGNPIENEFKQNAIARGMSAEQARSASNANMIEQRASLRQSSAIGGGKSAPRLVRCTKLAMWFCINPMPYLLRPSTPTLIMSSG